VDETDLLVREKKKAKRPVVRADPGDTGQGRFGMHFHTLATTHKRACIRVRVCVCDIGYRGGEMRRGGRIQAGFSENYDRYVRGGAAAPGGRLVSEFEVRISVGRSEFIDRAS